MKQHIRNIKLDQTDKLGVASHIWEQYHCFEEVKLSIFCPSKFYNLFYLYGKISREWDFDFLIKDLKHLRKCA